jgi:serine phosphatase RsbU (regulator of sigma subunit)
MLCESTPVGHFATLFFGVYNDASRRFSYINCGHNPAFCLRRDGSVERLGATATVLGAFEDWECALGRLPMHPGDLLAIYSDGITEATRQHEQFGEERLIDVLRGCSGASAESVVAGSRPGQEFGPAISRMT